MRIARSMAHAFAVVLIERVPRVAARASAPTWSTPGRPCRNARRAASDRTTSANALSCDVAVTVMGRSLRASRLADLAKSRPP